MNHLQCNIMIIMFCVRNFALFLNFTRLSTADRVSMGVVETVKLRAVYLDWLLFSTFYNPKADIKRQKLQLT